MKFWAGVGIWALGLAFGAGVSLATTQGNVRSLEKRMELAERQLERLVQIREDVAEMKAVLRRLERRP